MGLHGSALGLHGSDASLPGMMAGLLLFAPPMATPQAGWCCLRGICRQEFAQHDGHFAPVCAAHSDPTSRLALLERQLQAGLVQLFRQTCMALPSACLVWDTALHRATGTCRNRPSLQARWG